MKAVGHFREDICMLSVSIFWMPSVHYTQRCFTDGSRLGVVLPLIYQQPPTSPPALMKGRKDVEAEENKSAGDLHGAQKTTPAQGFGALFLRIQRSGSERHLHHLLKQQR